MHEDFQFHVWTFLADFRDLIQRQFTREDHASQPQLLPEAHGGEIHRVGLNREMDGHLWPGFQDQVDEAGVGHDQCIRLQCDHRRHVVQVGLDLGLPPEIVWRHPFPGPGLAIRIVGAIDENRLEILRDADAIAREELTVAGLDRDVWQFPVVLLADVRSVGVQGDGRTYGHPIVLRPVSSEDAMTADWSRLPYDVLERISTRITNEVREVNRVVLDITSKPPGTIEWE